MIQFHDVTKTFADGVTALSHINVHIGKEEFIFIVGPSGAGKSTLLKMLYMEEKPTSGRVMVDRVALETLTQDQIPYLRRNVGVVFQDFKLLPKRTVYENVAFSLAVTGTPKSRIRRYVTQALDLVGLMKKANSMPDQLSGGEQQRASIARAIVNSPSLLVADEPTGNLDPATSWEIIQLLDKINKRHTTVVVATHNKSIVDGMRKRVIALENGQIVRDQQLGSYSSAV